MLLHDFNQKLGQLFIVGFKGYKLSKETKQFLQKVQPGGVVFFEENIKTKKQVKNLIKEINHSIKIKPFIAVDEEGGSVQRLRKICTSLPSVWGLSKIGLKELLPAQEIIANNLLELGFNMNLGPVLDINSNFANPIIGTRSISYNPKIVSEYGSKIVDLFLKHKIIPVVKHFPGHGDLDLDSHLAMPILNKSKNELNNFELLPFKKVIKNNAPVVMVGHIQLPKIEKDKTRPATLSKNILQGLLRKDLGFKGLIITDELNMKGVTKNYTLTKACNEAIIAGADMVLLNTETSSTIQAYSYIRGRILKDNNLSNRINESYKRITFFKKRFLANQKILVKSKHNNSISRKLSKKVVHWIKRDSFYEPIKNANLEIIYPITPKLKTEDLKNILRNLGLRNYHLLPYNLNPPLKNTKKIEKHLLKSKSKRKLLITYDALSRPGQKTLIKTIFRRDPNLVLISVGLEYDIEIAPKIKNFIAAYAPNYISLKATFEKLLRYD